MGRKGAYKGDLKSTIHAIMMCELKTEFSFVLEQWKTSKDAWNKFLWGLQMPNNVSNWISLMVLHPDLEHTAKTII